jgi:glycosyltransferase involved in cell wall biosynthesis
MTELAGRRVIHVTTSDISLVLLLGDQLRAFQAEGMEVLGASAPGPFVDQLTAWGITHVPLRNATRSVSPTKDLLALPELVRVFKRLRPDIVHTHNPKPGLYGRVAARMAGVGSVVNTVHGLYAAPEDPVARKVVLYALERAASSCSDAELFQNPEDLQVMRQWRVPPDKLTLLGNGVDLERFHIRGAAERAQARQAFGVDEHKVVVGTVGRLVWGKGFKELFAAAAHLRTISPDVVLVIVGPTDEAKGDALGAEDISEAEALGNIVFTGHRDDVDRLYGGIDLFALPSYREGFPRSAMEAAASGVPVVATDIRGCRQAVDHGVTGLLVPVRNAEALAVAIAELAADPERRAAMGARGRQKAEVDFDDQQVIGRTLEVYRALVAAATTSPAT